MAICVFYFIYVIALVQFNNNVLEALNTYFEARGAVLNMFCDNNYSSAEIFLSNHFKLVFPAALCLIHITAARQQHKFAGNVDGAIWKYFYVEFSVPVALIWFVYFQRAS